MYLLAVDLFPTVVLVTTLFAACLLGMWENDFYSSRWNKATNSETFRDSRPEWEFPPVDQFFSVMNCNTCHIFHIALNCTIAVTWMEDDFECEIYKMISSCLPTMLISYEDNIIDDL